MQQARHMRSAVGGDDTALRGARRGDAIRTHRLGCCKLCRGEAPAASRVGMQLLRRGSRHGRRARRACHAVRNGDVDALERAPGAQSAAADTAAAATDAHGSCGGAGGGSACGGGERGVARARASVASAPARGEAAVGVRIDDGASHTSVCA